MKESSRLDDKYFSLGVIIYLKIPGLRDLPVINNWTTSKQTHN
jgi:hypothetical protein